MLRLLFSTVTGALIWGALGAALVSSVPPDPVGYIGLGCMLLAAVVAVVRSRRPATIVWGFWRWFR